MYTRLPLGDGDSETIDGVVWWRILSTQGNSPSYSVNDAADATPLTLESHSYDTPQRVRWNGPMVVEYSTEPGSTFPGGVSAFGASFPQQNSRVIVDGSQVTQPVSGPLTDAQLAARLPLPVKPNRPASDHTEASTATPNDVVLLNSTALVQNAVYDADVMLFDDHAGGEAAGNAVDLELYDATNFVTRQKWRMSVPQGTTTLRVRGIAAPDANDVLRLVSVGPAFLGTVQSALDVRRVG